jgi:hypothetical protein
MTHGVRHSTGRRPPAGLYRRRSLGLAEALVQQFLGPGGHVSVRAPPSTEPGRRPGPALDDAQVAPDIVQHGWHLILGQFLDQAQEFVPLHTHAISLRSLVPAHRVKRSAWCQV